MVSHPVVRYFTKNHESQTHHGARGKVMGSSGGMFGGENVSRSRTCFLLSGTVVVVSGCGAVFLLVGLVHCRKWTAAQLAFISQMIPPTHGYCLTLRLQVEASHLLSGPCDVLFSANISLLVVLQCEMDWGRGRNRGARWGIGRGEEVKLG